MTASPHTSMRRRRRALALALALAAIVLAPGAGSAAAAPTLYVSAGATSDPACANASQSHPFATLAGALGCAVNGTTIHIGHGTFAGEVTIAHNVTLTGTGAGTVIAHSGPGTPPDLSPTLSIPDGHSVTIRNLTIDGVDQYGPGIVAGSGSLTLIQATVRNSGNHSTLYGAGIAVVPASGSSQVTIRSSTIDDNLSDYSGGGVYVTAQPGSTSQLTVVDSTLTANDGEFGAAIALGDASATVRDSTIAGNTGSQGAVYVFNASNQPPVSLTNTILADNGGQDCAFSSRTVVDGGHNVIGSPCPGFTDGVNGDQVGASSSSPLDPVLGPLAANGGPTQTLAPLSGSPAINAGDAVDCQAAPVGGRDQRGRPRSAPSRLACDVGAYDTLGAVQTLYVSRSAASDPACADASAANPFATLAGALACADNGATIKVGTGTFAGQVTIDHNVVVKGAGSSTVIAGPTTLDNLAPDITVADGRIVTLQKLTVDGIDQDSPGVAAGGGTLRIIQSTLTRNGDHEIPTGGGALSVTVNGSHEAHVTVFDSTIDDNYSDFRGGGIGIDTGSSPGTAQGNTLDVVNSTVTANQATGGTGYGGGVYLGAATGTVRESTVTGNSGTAGGGGIYSGFSPDTLTVTGSIVAANSASSGAPDCSAHLATGSFNVIGQSAGTIGSGCGFVDGVDGNHAGTAGSPLDPQLGPLAANGGLTKTTALLAGSPAIGAGSSTDCVAWPVNGHDQRGRPRNVASRDACDAGAYDTGGVTPAS